MTKYNLMKFKISPFRTLKHPVVFYLRKIQMFITIMQRGKFFENILPEIMRVTVLVVSVVLIALISVDTFSDSADFLRRIGLYSRFQTWICFIYMADFFVELFAAQHRTRYFLTHLLYLIISIPYSLIISRLGIHVGDTFAYILHFMPTARAAVALAIVVSYVSRNKVIGLFASYLSMMVLVVYFSSLLFYSREGGGVNPAVTSYWVSLWWCLLQSTTLGASFYAVTAVGKAIAMVTSVMGVLMFPLFTVYLSSMVKKYLASHTLPSKKNS